jgi:hypothetical protein
MIPDSSFLLVVHTIRNVSDEPIESFFSQRARKCKTDVGTLINTVLRKEMEFVKELGA